MILTLEVIGEQAQDLGASGRKIFNAIGGTIGRLPDNDWVFPDPYVSGRHALIRYLNGKYFIEDTSTNGVFVNTPDHRISRTESHQLHDGDVVYIDAYQIKVTIAKDPEAKEEDDPFAQLHARQKGGGPARCRRRVRRRMTARIARRPCRSAPPHGATKITPKAPCGSARPTCRRARSRQYPRRAKPSRRDRRLLPTRVPPRVARRRRRRRAASSERTRTCRRAAQSPLGIPHS